MPPFLFADALRNLGREIQSQTTLRLDWVGLGPSQKDILFLVAQTPGITQAAVSHRLGLHKSVISRAVAALRRAGYLQEKCLKSGSRERGLLPTRMAATLRRTISASTSEVEVQLTEGFSRQELDQFKLYIQRAQMNLARQRAGTPRA